MIEIERRNWLVRIKTVYFSRQHESGQDGADVIGYIQTSVRQDGFERVDTVHIDLTRNEERLYAAIGKSTRNRINRASKHDGLAFTALAEPTRRDLDAFTEFYNAFARTKGTTLCRGYHVQTMKLLARVNALTVTRMDDSAGPLCYHVYVVDGHRAMLLYSGSHFRSARSAEERARLGRANRYLHWRDMLHFKERGFHVYDWGGLTGDPNIAQFKRTFGGLELTEYTGYVPVTLKGRAAAAARALLSAARYHIFKPRREAPGQGA
ncbi:MAG: GNAT family N-acetyltransferase [Burkholderiales bacterium]